jgi:hypothetical protein
VSKKGVFSTWFTVKVTPGKTPLFPEPVSSYMVGETKVYHEAEAIKLRETDRLRGNVCEIYEFSTRDDLRAAKKKLKDCIKQGLEKEKKNALPIPDPPAAQQILAHQPCKCYKCGGAMKKGETVIWERGRVGKPSGLSHIKCPRKESFVPEILGVDLIEAPKDIKCMRCENLICEGEKAHFIHQKNGCSVIWCRDHILPFSEKPLFTSAVYTSAQMDLTCAGCPKTIRAGALIFWSEKLRKHFHEKCYVPSEVEPFTAQSPFSCDKCGKTIPKGLKGFYLKGTSCGYHADCYWEKKLGTQGSRIRTTKELADFILWWFGRNENERPMTFPWKKIVEFMGYDIQGSTPAAREVLAEAIRPFGIDAQVFDVGLRCEKIPMNVQDDSRFDSNLCGKNVNVEDIQEGVWVRARDLVPGIVILAEPSYLANRRENSIGKILKPLSQRPETWWVKHEHGIAPYSYSEIEALDPQPPPDPDEKDWRGSPIF